MSGGQDAKSGLRPLDGVCACLEGGTKDTAAFTSTDGVYASQSILVRLTTSLL